MIEDTILKGAKTYGFVKAGLRLLSDFPQNFCPVLNSAHAQIGIGNGRQCLLTLSNPFNVLKHLNTFQCNIRLLKEHDSTGGDVHS